MLTDHDLRRIRSTVDGLLPGTAIIQRSERQSDGSGGFTESWSAVGTVACHLLIDRSSSEDAVSGRIRLFSGYSILLPVGTDVRSADRIVANDATFEVVGYHGGNDLSGCLRCTLSRLGDA